MYSGGTLTSGANLNVSNAFSWTGGTLANNTAGTGSITIGSSASLSMSTTSALSLGVSLDNKGTATLSGTSGSPGLALGSGVNLLNDSTGTFTDQTTVKRLHQRQLGQLHEQGHLRQVRQRRHGGHNDHQHALHQQWHRGR